MSQILLPGLSDDEQGILNHLLTKLEQKTSRNLLRSSYYDGKRAIRQVGDIIPPQYYNLGLVLGWSAKAVDVLARRCNLDTFVWPDGTLDDSGFREILEGNHLASEISSAAVSSLLYGPAFLINTLGDASVGEPLGLIHVKDATTAAGEWNPRTRRLDSLLSITRRDQAGQVTGLVLYLRGLTITAGFDGYEWSTERYTHPWGMPVEPFVYKPRVGRPFGQSRISRVVMSLHDQALRTVIRMEGHADVYSFPEMWLLGADEGIFKNSDGTQKAIWQVMLGRIKGVPDDEDAENPRADVKQFSASSPQPHIDQFRQQAAQFAGETDLPVSALGVLAENNTSTSDGSDNANNQLIAEAEGATDDWGPPLRRSVVRAMAMHNGLTEVPKEWASIAPKWRSPVHISRAAQADAGMKQLTAVPWLADTEVGLELLGLDEQQIQRAQSDKRRMSGSAALRTITQAAQTAQDATEPAADAVPVDAPVVVDAAGMKAKFDALGAAIRSGVEPKSAARLLGLDGLEFTGAVPVSLRIPESDAAALESQ